MFHPLRFCKQKLVKHVDIYGDGVVSFRVFYLLISFKQELVKHVDIDGDGVVSFKSVSSFDIL